MGSQCQVESQWLPQRSRAPCTYCWEPAGPQLPAPWMAALCSWYGTWQGAGPGVACWLRLRHLATMPCGGGCSPALTRGRVLAYRALGQAGPRALRWACPSGHTGLLPRVVCDFRPTSPRWRCPSLHDCTTRSSAPRAASSAPSWRSAAGCTSTSPWRVQAVTPWSSGARPRTWRRLGSSCCTWRRRR